MSDQIESENTRRTSELQDDARASLAAAISSPYLTDTTRRTRKMLILWSAIILMMVWVGIVPTEISAIGVRFELSGQLSLVASGGLVVLYFLALYFVQMQYDASNWQTRKNAAKEAAENANVNVEHFLYGHGSAYRSNDPHQYYFLIDFLLPLALGIIAIFSAASYIYTNVGRV